jgi:AraC-like DNA-binding protein
MPHSRLLAFDDPYAYQAAVRAAEVEVLVTDKGRFEAALVQIDLDHLWMQQGYDSLPRIARAANHPRRAAIEFASGWSHAPLQFDGKEVSAGEIIVDGLGSVTRERSTGPHRWSAMSLTPEDLAAAGEAIAGRELIATKDTHVVKPPEAQMSRLMTLHGSAVQLARSAPDVLALPSVARELEQQLVHAMVWCLAGDVPAGTRPHAGQRSKVIAKFEDFLAARQYEPAYLAEICTAIGASERTLRTCCHEYFGMGPMHYLWLRRMHLARRALLGADPQATTVTAVATDYGFWELGRFSVDYRMLFGELPSASLRRPAEQMRDAPAKLAGRFPQARLAREAG